MKLVFSLSDVNVITFLSFFYVFSVMFERLSKDESHFEDDTRKHIDKYSQVGLRIMVIAYRELGEEEYKLWEEEFLKAKVSLSADRDALLDTAADKIERELILLGATAVEDKLQEGVKIHLMSH